MTKGRPPSDTPVARGALGHSMMSAVADLAPPESAAEQGAEPGSDLQTELQKLDRAALTRPARQATRHAGPERTAARRSALPIITMGAAAIILAAAFKAVRGGR